MLRLFMLRLFMLRLFMLLWVHVTLRLRSG